MIFWILIKHKNKIKNKNKLTGNFKVKNYKCFGKQFDYQVAKKMFAREHASR